MSKNQKTYLLLFAVVLVWGAIGFQFFSNYGSTTVEVAPIKTKIPDYSSAKSKVIYTIQPDYRDPFLGKLYRKPVKKKKTPPPSPSPKIVVVFPNIVFKGVIQGGEASFIVSINEMDEIFKAGDTYKEVKLIKGDEKEILVEYQKEKKAYPLRQ